MRKRAAVHSYDIALGLVWLVIIFCGLLYLLRWDRAQAPEVVENDPTFEQRMDVLDGLSSEASVPDEADRLRVLAELNRSTETDDRSSVYPGSHADASVEDKLEMLQALRTAR